MINIKSKLLHKDNIKIFKNYQPMKPLVWFSVTKSLFEPHIFSSKEIEQNRGKAILKKIEIKKLFLKAII